MDMMNASDFRTQLASMMDKVNDDHTELLITRQGGKPAVLLSLEDFKIFQETAYLMSSPKNAKRLNKAISEVEAGKMVRHGLIEK